MRTLLPPSFKRLSLELPPAWSPFYGFEEAFFSVLPVYGEYTNLEKLRIMYDGLSTAEFVLPLDFWKIIDAHGKYDIHLKYDVIHREHKSSKLINDHS